MPIEYETRHGALLWIRNPITGVVSYVVDVRGKSFAYTLGGRDDPDPAAPALSDADLRHATGNCPFCPGNEELSPPEVFRVRPEECPGWSGAATHRNAGWVIRVFNNLFPRIPDALTGGRNESYILVEDPRHFLEHPRSLNDLMCTGSLGEEHCVRILLADAGVVRNSLENRAVHSVVIRKNQGRESGASQPHLHQQIIGSPTPLPALEAEMRASRENPKLFNEILEVVEKLDLVLENHDGIVSYASPIGAFPRSYDVVMPDFEGFICELSEEELYPFARALYRVLRILGPLPLDYEIHQGEGVPIHAHINARLYPYSNVAGTLNIPKTLLDSAAAIRKALARL